MKIKHFLALAAMTAIGGGSAWAADEITSGTSYYIQNVESGLFLCGANAWGTQGSVSTQGEMFKVDLNNGTYTLTNQVVTASNKTLGYNLFVDSNTGENGNTWTIAPVDGEEGVYTIYGKGKAGKVDNAFDGYLSQSATAGAHIGYAAGSVKPADNTAKWRFLTKDEAIAQLKTVAWGGPGKSASFLIENPNFSRNHSTAKWTVSSDCNNKNLAGGDNGNMCAESYHSKFTISQTLQNIPNGVYGVTAQGFVRGDGGNVTDVVFFANEATQAFPVKTGTENSMTDASNSFKTGAYTIEEFKVTVTNGTLEIGVKNTSASLWCIWDNFNITYYGVDVTELQNTLAGRVTVAEGITGKMNADVSAALATAINNANNCAATEEAISAAINEINTAITNAETSVAYYAAITAKYNGLDAAGKAAFDASESGVKYAAGTLTNEDVNTDYIAAVKAQGNNSDWTALITNNSFENEVDSWTNGSMGFQTNASFEHKDGNKYCEAWQPNGTRSIKKTLSGLRSGQYRLNLWIKARGLNSAKVYAGSAETPVEIADKETDVAVTFVVLEDGNVEIGVSADCNGAANSWLAFDNFRLTYVSAELPALPEAATGKMNAEVAQAQENAIAAFNEDNTNASKYNAAVEAINNAKASADIYAQISAINTKAAALDAAGQAAYAPTLAAYNNGTFTTVDEAQTGLIAAVKAQTTDGADFTELIVNPSFETGNMNGWTAEGNGGAWALMTRANDGDPKVGNYWYEKYGWSGKIDVKQTITGVPAGVYTVGVKTLDQASMLKLVAKCGDTTAETIIDKGTATDFTVDIAVDDNSDITIGLYCENHPVNTWVGFDNFTLHRSDFGALTAAEGKMNAAVATAQANAIETYNTNKTIANYNAAVAAIAAAQASVNHYAGAKTNLDAMNAIMDATNVYDAEAYAASAWTVNAGKYENNTLTNEETVVNPHAATAWHGTTAYNFLLTPWTIGGQACNNFDKALYINTWSNEGATDGSNFTVPFFEYWVADGQSLAANAISTTIDVENGLYELSALVRTSHNSEVKAINLTVNDGEAVNVADGTQIGTTSRYMNSFVAQGLVKDGKLTVTFDVPAESNVSWLCFKDVKYTKVRDLTPEEEMVYATEEEIAAFNASIEAAEAKTLGFQAGEYAPYNNAAAIATLKAAKALDVENPIDIEVLAPAKEALDNAVWTVNAEEVNAVYDGGFSKTTIVRDATSFLPTGWTNTGTNTRVYKDATANKGISATSEGACLFAKFTTTYGEVEGYEMPLKAGKYTLNFIYGGWNEVGTRDIKVYSAADNSVAATVNPNKVTAKNNTAHTTASSWSSYEGLITIPSDGNYILSFYRQNTSSQNQICISDLAIFSISETELAKRDLLPEIENYEVPTTNIGDAAFQYPTAGIEAVNATIEAAQAVYDNPNATLDEVNEAIQNMKNLTNPALNAPAAGDKFHVAITFNDYRYSGHALEANATAASGVAVPLADNTANNNYPNDWTFTPVAGTKNGYTMSITTAEGTYYVCTGKQDNGSNDQQIRMTTDPEKALTIVVAPTKSQEGVYYLNNTRSSNATIGCQDDRDSNGGWYTTGSHNTHTITLATKASANLKITDAHYGTFIAPFAAEIPEGVTAYKVSAAEGNVLTLVEDEDGFDANVPYIVYSESVVNETLQDWGLATKDSYTSGLLTGVYTSTAATNGSYVLQNNDNKVGFYQVDTEVATPTVGANRCYLTYTAPAGVHVRALYFGNKAAGINAEDAADDAVETIYNANGTVVSALQPGLNIVKMKSGKVQKVLVK